MELHLVIEAPALRWFGKGLDRIKAAKEKVEEVVDALRDPLPPYPPKRRRDPDSPPPAVRHFHFLRLYRVKVDRQGADQNLASYFFQDRLVDQEVVDDQKAQDLLWRYG